MHFPDFLLRLPFIKQGANGANIDTTWLQNLQAWVANIPSTAGGGGGAGTVTTITATAPAKVTPSPLTTIGNVSVSAATASALGVVRPDNVTTTVSGGVISALGGGGGDVAITATAPVVVTPNPLTTVGDVSILAATSSDLGVVKPDNSTITVAGGVLSAVPVSDVIPGPYADDAAAEAAGVPLLGEYFLPSGHVVVRLDGAPTITLASLINNNTSADPAYNKANFGPPHSRPMFDGTPGNPNVTIDDTNTDDSQNPITPGHVSDAPIDDMFPGLEAIPKAVHLVPWWGSSSHPNIGFPNFRSSAYIAALFADSFTRRKFKQFIFDWYGQGSYEDGSVLEVNARALALGIVGYEYEIMIDKGAIAGTGGTATTNLINAITYLNATYFSDSRYIKIGGRPVIKFFQVPEIAGIDMNAAKAAAASLGNPLFIDENTTNVAQSWCDGIYSWVAPYNPINHGSDPYGLNYLNGFITAINAHPGKLLWLSMWPGFDGTCTRNASWSLGKILQRDGGNCWVASCARVTSLAATLTRPSQLVGIQGVTLGDWEEGSQLEGGIENWATISASILSHTVSWSIAFGKANTSQSVLADLGVIDHINLYWSLDNVNLTQVSGALAKSTTSYDLSLIPGITSGQTIYMYIEYVGVACMRNHINSSAPSWTKP